MLLEVERLRIVFHRDGHEIVPVRDVSFSIPERGRVALVGESGCGKSLTALSLAGLPPTDRADVRGSIRFSLPGGRAPRLAYVFQNPMDALNPVMRVGRQIEEAQPPEERKAPRAERRTRVESLLSRTGLADPARAARSYPCELSGGQCQRAMIAMALAAEPDLLVADEPTTALDVTTQREVLDLIDALAGETGMAVMLITHNLGLVAGRMDSVNVMYAGAVVESGPVDAVLSAPRHPYTRGLLAAVPALDAPRDAPLADIPGTVPPPDAWPPGCAFHPRCPWAKPGLCDSAPPPCVSSGVRRLQCHLVGA